MVSGQWSNLARMPGESQDLGLMSHSKDGAFSLGR